MTAAVSAVVTYWGAEEEGVIGRQTERKALIAVAVEDNGSKNLSYSFATYSRYDPGESLRLYQRDDRTGQ